ncbi:MAG TPA: hypothetical protein VF265_07475 [Nevskiaceae bacterium]
MDVDPDHQRIDDARSLTLVVYGRYGLGLFVGVSGLAAVIINYINREQVSVTWLEGHFTRQIHTFWWSVLFRVCVS